uniref:Tex-like N-terminal domain-containing protein n=1 Tax=Ilyobacter sp. TaxID=3100343 RepID=UPI00356523FB
MSVFYDTVAKELKIKAHQVENTIKLLDEGATVPFVARYRKELTGDLDETVIRDILERMNYLRNLQKRKEEVLKSIEEQDKLTEELKGKILKAEKLQEVEDLYLPYKRKKKTKADIAKDQGLEPLAKLALGRLTYDELLKKSEEFLSEDVKTTEEAIEGVKLILAQENSENPLFREEIRGRMQKSASLYSKATKKAPELDIKQVYRDYYEYNEAVSKIPSHRILAVNRGENEKILNVSIKFDDKTRSFIENMILREYKNQGLKDFYLEIIKDSLDRLILPSIEREVRNILTEKAEGESIESFKENLKNLLMQPPLQDKNILGLDPAYRTGCKTVVIDKDGFFKCDDVLYLVEGMHNPKQLEQAKNKIIKYIDQYDIDIIAIGNGT